VFEAKQTRNSKHPITKKEMATPVNGEGTLVGSRPRDDASVEPDDGKQDEIGRGARKAVVRSGTSWTILLAQLSDGSILKA